MKLQLAQKRLSKHLLELKDKNNSVLKKKEIKTAKIK